MFDDLEFDDTEDEVIEQRHTHDEEEWERVIDWDAATGPTQLELASTIREILTAAGPSGADTTYLINTCNTHPQAVRQALRHLKRHNLINEAITAHGTVHWWSCRFYGN